MMCGDLHRTPEAASGRQEHICTDEEGHEGDHTCGACTLAWPNLYHGGKSEDEGLELTDEQKDALTTLTLHRMVDERGLVCVLDMLNEYCKKQEDNASELTNAFKPWGLSPKKRWWAARAHIEHCSNFVEMIEL